MKINRREVIAGGLAAAASAVVRGAPLAASAGDRRNGYGAAVTLADLQSDVRLKDAVTRYCTQIVPVYELKWPTVRPDAHTFSFAKADGLLDFARQNGLTMRGHNLVWYADLPAWTKEIKDAPTAERTLRDHIATVVSYYRGKLTSWDVVNEAIPDFPKRPTERRPSLWQNLLGDSYIRTAFRAAADADPDVQLVLNDYDIESVGERFAARRAALRNLVSDLLDTGTPINAVGLQSHLHGEIEIDTDGLARCVAEFRSWGLDVIVTELDVDDRFLPASVTERDAIVAKRVNDVLSTITSQAPLRSILTWGISDGYSWISQMFPRPDHLPNRPLPLDADFQPKPFMDVITKVTREAA
ncbi:MAG TPA: endo-1,4-beta-xylanase [Bradyrhizobium sp.]|uniref:endo-1,4-beta-xylanase n=1 Tax=Bradyrhizobium sp. TaxID=376 RepID=UPI002C3197A9|nr:endo-1,4-beta-xylanase [Bradyrhizobium sp.]HLZ02383.1 endo-1,4-beta-xylanase [Bradyrhizobium sp.]